MLKIALGIVLAQILWTGICYCLYKNERFMNWYQGWIFGQIEKFMKKIDERSENE